MLWKNEEAGITAVEKGKDKDRSPWAGRNPTVVVKVGKKPITGKWSPAANTITTHVCRAIKLTRDLNSIGLFARWTDFGSNI